MCKELMLNIHMPQRRIRECKRGLNNKLKNAKRAKTESHGKEMNKHESKIHASEDKLQNVK